MVIANPIYDVVFKRMMEDEKVAKFFISTLLDETVDTIEVKPQEFTFTKELPALAIFRLDFIATIKTANGSYKKILIEIQKAKNFIDLMRFRNYLGEQYKKVDIINNEKVALPITTIYILGFKLPEIETACLKVERTYQDLTNKKSLPIRCDFVEKLTHDSFIVQVDRITSRYQSRLDKLLSIFEQTNFVDDQKIIKEYFHELDIDELKIATDILHHAGTNPKEKKEIENEQEAWRTVYALSGDLREKLDNQYKAISQMNIALSEKDEALVKKEEALVEKNEALVKKDQILDNLQKEIEDLKRQLGK